MKANRALGDGQAKPGATCLAAARVVDAVEGPEKFIERIFRNSRTRVENANHGFGFALASSAHQPNFRAAAFLGVARGIADDVLNGTMQQCGNAHDLAIVLDEALDTAISSLTFEVCISDNFFDHLAEENRCFLPRVASAFEPGNGKQSANEIVKPIGFEIDALQGAMCFHAGALTGQGRSYVQTRKRRPQLMGDVVQQTSLSVH